MDPAALAGLATAGQPSGRLGRLLVGVKDLVAVAGVPLGAGSRARAGAPVEPRDAAIVAGLRAAGACIAGTVAMHELAFGVTGVNDQVGFPRNPFDESRVPGGSSSGSAVGVAQGSCDVAVGTDTGGSVRIPAALCGVAGFKPARPGWGEEQAPPNYPLDGVLPLSPSLDHVGLLARWVDHIAGVHTELTGLLVRPELPVRLGVDRMAMETAAEVVGTTVESALEALAARGCELVDIAWPDPASVREVSTTIMWAEAAATNRRYLDEAPHLLGADVLARLMTGASITDSAYQDAIVEARRITGAVKATLGTVDGVVGPTVPILAPTVEAARSDDALPSRLVSNTRLANLTGVPALSLPLPAADLPVGLQVVALSEVGLLGIGLSLARSGVASSGASAR
jgi:Asp-tRNA(Asn)/Glu-tRNA(Gln) amidotransferase A subunit family amidase